MVRASGTGEAGKQLGAPIGDKSKDNCPCRAEQAIHDDEVHPTRAESLHPTRAESRGTGKEGEG